MDQDQLRKAFLADLQKLKIYSREPAPSTWPLIIDQLSCDFPQVTLQDLQTLRSELSTALRAGYTHLTRSFLCGIADGMAKARGSPEGNEYELLWGIIFDFAAFLISCDQDEQARFLAKFDCAESNVTATNTPICFTKENQEEPASASKPDAEDFGDDEEFEPLEPTTEETILPLDFAFSQTTTKPTTEQKLVRLLTILSDEATLGSDAWNSVNIITITKFAKRLDITGINSVRHFLISVALTTSGFVTKLCFYVTRSYARLPRLHTNTTATNCECNSP